MNIKLSNKWAIRNDGQTSYALCKRERSRNKDTGVMEERWVAIAWYSRLEHAIDEVCNKRLRESKITTLKGLREAISQLRAEVYEAFSVVERPSA